MNEPANVNRPTADEFRPEVLFHRPDLYLLEFGGPNALFVRMNQETYRRSIFTDRQRIVPANTEGTAVPVIRLLDLFESQRLPQPRLCYIFHVAHCGSTLLSRAFDHSSDLLVCREPAALRQLALEFAATTDDDSQAANWHRRLQLVTGLLGRTYDRSKATIVKANVPVNFILPQLTELNPESCGILLYTTIRGYLLSVLKTPQHQQWVSNVVHDLAGAIRRIEPLTNVVPETLSPAKAAACLWLAQTINYRRLVESSDQYRTLDCEVMFDRPEDTLEAAFKLFGNDCSSQQVRDIVSGDLFSHHAKMPDVRFDNDARKAELATLAETLADEIDEAMAWASELMAPGDIADTLPNSLIS